MGNLLNAAEGPDTSLIVALYGLIGIVLTALFSFLAARYTARQATKAKELETQSGEKNADVNSWDKLVTSLQNELSRLNTRLEGLEKQSDADRKRIDSLEEQLRQGDVKYRVALQYIHDVIAWAKAVLKSDDAPPPPPPLIASDLEMH